MLAAHLLFGMKAEQIARQFLQKQGLIFVTGNFRTPLGEIDLIMEDCKTLVFVEVRARKLISRIQGAESINKRKQTRIIRTAFIYLQRFPSAKFCRFDVIAIRSKMKYHEINWIKDAFQVQ